MILTAVVAFALAQCAPYTRTKVDDADPKSHCLYWREGTTVEWRVNDQGNPETTGDTEFSAVAKSLATWQAELTACGSLTLKVGAKTTSRATEYVKGSATNQNVVLWRFQACTQIVGASDGCWKEDDCGTKFDCWQHQPGALAITTTNFEPSTGRILDADVELNTPSFVFTTVESPACVKPLYNQGCVASDVQNTMTHEFGHSLGLAHSCNSNSTMYASAGPGELGKRVLDTGSKAFICEVYPKTGESKDCVEKVVTPLTKPGCGCQSGPGVVLLGLALLLGVPRPRRERDR